MKLAVCISGQPRTFKYCIKSIYNYFGQTADYFCHAWNYNTYKIKDPVNGIYWKDDTVDLAEFSSNLAILRPKKILIEGVDALGHKRFAWDSMLYSTMMANNLKSIYEMETGTNYDLVIKTRYDFAYPDSSFLPSERILDKNLYNPQFDLFTQHTERMASEYDYLNISDVTYYGSSWAMNVAADLYWYTKRKFGNKNFFDAYILGPGTLMSEYIASNNLRFCHDGRILEVIYRTDAIPMDPLTDYSKIHEIHRDMYL